MNNYKEENEGSSELVEMSGERSDNDENDNENENENGVAAAAIPGFVIDNTVDTVINNQNGNGNNRNGSNDKMRNDNGYDFSDGDSNNDWEEPSWDGSDGSDFVKNENKNKKENDNNNNTMNMAIGEMNDMVSDEDIMKSLDPELVALMKQDEAFRRQILNDERKKRERMAKGQNEDDDENGAADGLVAQEMIEGLHTRFRPNMVNVGKSYRCWECPRCEATNKLRDSFGRGFVCVNRCGGQYAPSSTFTFYSNAPQLVPFDEGLNENENDNGENDNPNRVIGNDNGNNNRGIDANDDEMFPEPVLNGENGYDAWQCPMCGHFNDTTWIPCVVENCSFTRETCWVEPIHSVEKPQNPTKSMINQFSINENNYRANFNNVNNVNNFNDSNNNHPLLDHNGNVFYHDYNNNRNNNRQDYRQAQRKKQYEARFRKFGQLTRFVKYPSSNVLFKSNERLTRRFGYPYTNVYYANPMTIYGISNLIPSQWAPIAKNKGAVNDAAINKNNDENKPKSKENENESDEKAEKGKGNGNVNGNGKCCLNNVLLPLKLPRGDLKVNAPNNNNNDNNNNNNNNNDNSNRNQSLTTKFYSDRNMAINGESGWIAVITQSQTAKPEIILSVYQCIGSFEYKRVCSNRISSIVDEIIEASGRRTDINQILAMMRVRFVGNSVYILGWAEGDKLKKVYEFELRHRIVHSRVLPMINDYSLAFVREFSDDYWDSCGMIDVDFVHYPNGGGDLLVILFNRWIGYYHMIKSNNNAMANELEWYHACAYVKTVGSREINSHSFEVISYDHTSDDNLYCNEISVATCSEIQEKMVQHQRKIDEKIASERKEDNQTYTNYAQINVIGRNMRTGRLQCDYSLQRSRLERKSHQYYNYIHCENDIVTHHPSNASYEFMRSANDVKPSQLYAVSKEYGTFITDNDKQCVYSCQSDGISVRKTKIFTINDSNDNDNENENDDEKKENKFCQSIVKLVYDEGFGISGRLLVLCDNGNGDYDMRSIVNDKECYELDSQMKINVSLLEENENENENDDNSKSNDVTTIKSKKKNEMIDERMQAVQVRTNVLYEIYSYCYGNEFLNERYS